MRGHRKSKCDNACWLAGVAFPLPGPMLYIGESGDMQCGWMSWCVGGCGVLEVLLCVGDFVMHWILCSVLDMLQYVRY